MGINGGGVRRIEILWLAVLNTPLSPRKPLTSLTFCIDHRGVAIRLVAFSKACHSAQLAMFLGVLR